MWSMSIPHIDKLSNKKFNKIVTGDWSVKEKIDGSSVTLISCKGIKTLKTSTHEWKSFSEIPEECWTRDFRICFKVLEKLEGDFFLEGEFIGDRQTNTITYDESWCFVSYHGFNHKPITVSVDIVDTDDGMCDRKVSKTFTVKFINLPSLKLEKPTFQSHDIKIMKHHWYEELLTQLDKESILGGTIEGLVVICDDVMFKIVDRDKFTKLNYFYHFVKYCILGRSYKSKFSLLRIWQKYPKEEQLYHLDRYRKKYLRYRNKMNFNNHSYNDSIHEKTLRMFSDTRKRINGR